MITTNNKRGHLRGHLRGFTLIELLVVIAIIGILSAVVLAALNTARSKGNDAAVKSNLTTIETQSAIYYDSNSNAYSTASAATTAIGVSGAWATTNCTLAGTLFVDPNIAAAITSANAATSPTNSTKCAIVSGSSGSYGGLGSTVFASAWGVYAPIQNPSGNYFCVDSTGKAEVISSAPAAVTAASTVICT